LEVTEATQTPPKILESTRKNTNHYTTKATYTMKVDMFLRYRKCKYKLEDERHHTNETTRVSTFRL